MGYRRLATDMGLCRQSAGFDKMVREMARICAARNRKGEPCKSTALYENGRCRFHGGLSTGPRTPEGKARSLAARMQGYQAWLHRQRTLGAPAGNASSAVFEGDLNDLLVAYVRLLRRISDRLYKDDWKKLSAFGVALFQVAIREFPNEQQESLLMKLQERWEQET